MALAELARRLGEDPHWVQRRLKPTPRNKADITADEVPRIANALGVNCMDLFEGSVCPEARGVPIGVPTSLAERLHHAIDQVLGEAEAAPRFGTPEYQRQRAQELTTDLSRVFADLPEEEQMEIWATVDERRRLRERQVERPEQERAE